MGLGNGIFYNTECLGGICGLTLLKEEQTPHTDETVLPENRFVLIHFPPAEYEARLVAGNIKGEAAPLDLNRFTFHNVLNGK